MADKEFFRPRRAESLGLITNYRCTFRCRHCLYGSSPQVPEKPDDDRLEELIEQVERVLGRVPMHIGGGEPLVHFDRIEKLADLFERGIDLRRHPILESLLRGGVKALYDQAVGEGFQPDPRGCGSSCHLCLELRVYFYGRGLGAPELYPDFLYEEMGALRPTNCV